MGWIGFLPISISIDLAMTGWKSKILGYSSIGLIVPDVSITEGNDFQMGFIDKEQSKQDNVIKGSAIFPSIGWGWCTILNPSWCIKINSQKKVTRLRDLTSYTSVICNKFKIFESFYWASLKKVSSKFVFTLI